MRFYAKSRDAVLALLFVALLALDLALQWFRLASGFATLLSFILVILGVVLAVRFIRRGLREAIWRLRNRLIVTYLFIAVVPIVLLLALAALGTYMVAGQMAVYLVTSELNRRDNELDGPSRFLLQAKPEARAAILRQMGPMIEEGLPGFEAVASGEHPFHYPENSSLGLPQADWKRHAGYFYRDGRFYCFSLASSAAGKVFMMAPIDAGLLGRLVPGIGLISLSRIFGGRERNQVAGAVPAPRGFWDFETTWLGFVPFVPWNSPGSEQTAYMGIQTRPSSVLGVLFDTRSDDLPLALVFFLAVSGLLLIVLVLSGVIGVSLTRTITGAVHDLYEGTTRIARGDFAYRIPVKGNDQLAALGTSFNNMTTRLESLVAVAKEKERLQSEVEIASDVQSQLFPRSAPAMRTIELFGKCHPARMVSGDYYDYLCLPNGNLAVAIGDVAGKGISAALLMASIQSIMRTQLAAGGHNGVFSTSTLVAMLNRQLYASTAPEKYATFFFGMYDENSRILTYTNAGHLPPLLLHNGSATLLEVTGTVVGAFPSVRYGEESIRIDSGDILIAYTDGITEPENDYGEEFGTDRLAATALQHRSAGPCEIVDKLMDAVILWSTAPELPDDMTVVMARGLA